MSKQHFSHWNWDTIVLFTLASHPILPMDIIAKQPTHVKDDIIT
jgi:hypothetical protein